MTAPGFTVLSAALAAGLAASAAALVLYRKVRRMRRTEETLARILGGLTEEGFHPDMQAEVQELRDLAGSAGPGPAARAANAAATLAERLSEAMPVYSDYRSGRTLPPCFVPRTLGPDGILRGLGRAEGPGCEAAGYAAWPYRSEWMEFHTPNQRYAWFAHFRSAGNGMESALLCRTMANLLRNELASRGTSLHRPETLPEILYRVNEHLVGQGFEGIFVAACLGLWDRQESEAVLCGAGISRILRWNAGSRSARWAELLRLPTLGTFPNFMIETRFPFKTTRVKLDSGDALVLTSDTNNSIRYIRDGDGRIATNEITASIGDTQTTQDVQLFEHFDSGQRIESLLEAVGSRSTWRLEKEGGLPGEEDLVFDFSDCEGRPEDFALALAAAERIFRMYPDPGAGPEDRVFLDPVTDAFLVRHFPKVGLYRKEGMVRVLEREALDRAGGGGFWGEGKVVEWRGIREDRQYDVSILAIGRKE